MIINSSNVGMESARTYRSSTTRKLSLSANAVMYSFADNALGNQELPGGNSEELLETGRENADAAEKQTKENTNATEKQAKEDAMAKLKSTSSSAIDRIREISNGSETKSIERIRQRCILYLWELFFGKERASRMSEDYAFEESGVELAQPRELKVIQLSATEEYSFSETETMDFSTTGTVKTADGREISFHMNVGMSRSFSEYYKREGIEIAAMCDPLVINLDDNVVGLSDQKFFFDLDADGTEEEISTLETGNAFLALDRNQDGRINDGSELFGAKSGDGFGELAVFDEDGNGWIDENDSVFEKLKIWIKDDSGEDKLYTLKEKGLGAIYLGSASTDYTLRSDTTLQVNGAIRRSGVFLYENGMAGSIAHVDIAKRAYESA